MAVPSTVLYYSLYDSLRAALGREEGREGGREYHATGWKGGRREIRKV